MKFLDRYWSRSDAGAPEAAAHTASLPPAAPRKPRHRAAQPVVVPDHALAPGDFVSRLDAGLITLSAEGDNWRVEDAAAGLSVLGANGSGKTSTSGATVAKAYLRAGWGGLVLCAKADEAALWERYARETGRSGDVIRVSRDAPWRLNFIDYEMGRDGDPTTRVENLISTLMNLMEQQGRTQGGGDTKFWQQAAEALLRHTLMLLSASGNAFTLYDVQKFIDSIPMGEVSPAEIAGTSFGEVLDAAKAAYLKSGRLADFDVLANYFRTQFPRLAERTRSSITITLGTMLQDLLTGTPRELFATGTNFFPEDSFEGAIIIVDLPVIENRINRSASILLKTVWQQAALRRQGGDPQKMRPTFLWADEAHLFLTEFDTVYQSLARSAKACTVYLSQNLSNYEAELGERGEVLARRLMGLFQTHLFHAQTDTHTLDWIIKLFGKTEVTRLNRSFSRQEGDSYSVSRNVNENYSAQGGGSSHGHGSSRGESNSTTFGHSESTTVEDALFAEHLTSLKNGSDRYGGVSAAFVFKNANRWRSGTSILYTQFTRKVD